MNHLNLEFKVKNVSYVPTDTELNSFDKESFNIAWSDIVPFLYVKLEEYDIEFKGIRKDASGAVESIRFLLANCIDKLGRKVDNREVEVDIADIDKLIQNELAQVDTDDNPLDSESYGFSIENYDEDADEEISEQNEKEPLFTYTIVSVVEA